jgi:hypothetical protein
MWVYHKFRKFGWTPEQVRELTLQEQFWLPVIDDAESIAVSQLSSD